jgi:hypothetical protein
MTKKAGAPKYNTNAEKWTLEVATKFMNDAVELSKQTETTDTGVMPKYDFIGEVAYDLDQDKGVFDYLITKFPELKPLKKRIKNNCEVNCFRNIKRENINTGAGIMNLKSNHGWTDRVQQDHTTQGKALNTPLLNIDPLQDENDNGTS